MEEWTGRMAVVTGANSGIGCAITKRLLERGMNVVAMDKNIDKLLAMMDDSRGTLEGKLHPLSVDLCDDEAVREAFQSAEDMLNGIDVLVNNAGVSGRCSLLDGSPMEWRCILDVNIVALCLCTKEAVASMTKRNIKRGQIINISSNLSHTVPTYPPFHFYSATKHAVQALTEGYRQELRTLGTTIRISSICPGLVRTGIFKASLGDSLEKLIFKNHPYLEPDDIASTIEFILSTPQHVQIHDLTVKPMGSEN
ncbi:hypothetical protein AAG570_008485 [Ranatra chinensis]|uniref:Uncharacterized protein n=1 Tax=Ranatra chinensis TaxID=642074 RepID=A0ABD0YR38_9HEMI